MHGVVFLREAASRMLASEHFDGEPMKFRGIPADQLSHAELVRLVSWMYERWQFEADRWMDSLRPERVFGEKR
jgi:hypothetical protein